MITSRYRFFLSLLSCLLILTTGCGDDEGDSRMTEIDQLVESTQTGVELNTSTTGVGKDIDWTITYNDDGTFSSSGSYVLDSHVVITGFSNQDFMQDVPVNKSASGIYTYNPPILTTTNQMLNGQPVADQVAVDNTAVISGNTMDFSSSVTGTEESFGVVVTTNTTQNIKFVKE